MFNYWRVIFTLAANYNTISRLIFLDCYWRQRSLHYANTVLLQFLDSINKFEVISFWTKYFALNIKWFVEMFLKYSYTA